MKLSRNFTYIFRFILDELVPPFLRDSKWFMWPLFAILFKKKTKYFMDFKANAAAFSSQQIAEIYAITHDVHLDRETDINEECLTQLKKDVIGETVLDAGCGNGFLMRILESKRQTTGCDINHYNDFKVNEDSTEFITSSLEELPFKDNEFDTVICAHTLEHTVSFERAFSQLQRVAKKKLIIIVPMQREYKYTFDLHLQFFPNPFSFLLRVPKREVYAQNIQIIKGDIYYQEIYQKQ